MNAEEFTYVLQLEHGRWDAYVRELVPGRPHPERPVITGAPGPFAALEQARGWMRGLMGACDRAGLVLTAGVKTTTRLVYQPTQLRCGCNGTQVHVFHGEPPAFTMLGGHPWADAAALEGMRPIDAVMAVDMDHRQVFSVPLPFPAWDPDDPTMPAIVTRAPFTAVCHCIHHDRHGGKQRRVVIPEHVPTMHPIPPPFVELR
jgi:hypothetical protein